MTITNFLSRVIISIICWYILPTVSIAQNVSLPDTNFKAALVGNAAINTNGDSEIQVAEASVYSGTIDVINLGISD